MMPFQLVWVCSVIWWDQASPSKRVEYMAWGMPAAELSTSMVSVWLSPGWQKAERS